MNSEINENNNVKKEEEASTTHSMEHLDFTNSVERNHRKFDRQNNQISQDLKQVIVDAIESGTCSREEAAVAFNLPYSTVVRIYRRYLETGHIKKKKRTSFLDSKLKDEHINYLLTTLAKNCKYTLKELGNMVNNEFGIKVSLTTIAKHITCFHFNLHRLQNVTLDLITPAIVKDHQEYCKKYLRLNETARTMIYLDLTEFHVTMRVLRGRLSENPQNAMISPSIRKRNKTIIASMTNTELLFYRAVEGFGEKFSLFDHLKDFFINLKRRKIVNAVVIMGNTIMAKNPNEIKAAFQLAGHELLCLPNYSPFLNPVESLFSQWENMIRERKPLNVTELEQIIVSFNDLISTKHCQNFCKDLIDISVSCSTGDFECDA